jgi:hypothetical protein
MINARARFALLSVGAPGAFLTSPADATLEMTIVIA